MKPKEPKLKDCANAECSNQFRQFNSLVKVCSTACAIKRAKEKNQAAVIKDWEKEKKVRKPKVYSKENKQYFQNEMNKLARMIDDQFGYGCISCGTKKDVQYAGGHRFSVGSNESIRYNLHDIHKQCNKNCNKHLGGNPFEYDKGLISRHGIEYKDLVHGLGLKYPYIGLKSNDYPEKLKIVRKLIRDFDTFSFKDAIQARTMFNNLISIYK